MSHFASVSRMLRGLPHLSVRSDAVESPCRERSWQVRRLTHPEDDSATWFLGSRDVYVVEDRAVLDTLLTDLGASRGSLRFDPPTLRSAFEREFGPCAPQPAFGAGSEASRDDSSQA